MRHPTTRSCSSSQCMGKRRRPAAAQGKEDTAKRLRLLGRRTDLNPGRRSPGLHTCSRRPAGPASSRFTPHELRLPALRVQHWHAVRRVCRAGLHRLPHERGSQEGGAVMSRDALPVSWWEQALRDVCEEVGIMVTLKNVRWKQAEEEAQAQEPEPAAEKGVQTSDQSSIGCPRIAFADGYIRAFPQPALCGNAAPPQVEFSRRCQLSTRDPGLAAPHSFQSGRVF